MQQHFPWRYVTGDADARAPGRFADDEAVVVETKTGANVPVAPVNVVLEVQGGFDVPAMIGKRKLQLSPGIESGGISDLVSQRFVYWSEQYVDSGFPVVMGGMASDVATEIAFAVAATLRHDHRSGEVVRTQL